MVNPQSLSRQGSAHSLCDLDNGSQGPSSSGTNSANRPSSEVLKAAPTLPGAPPTLKKRLTKVYEFNNSVWPQSLIGFLNSQTGLSQDDIIEALNFIKGQPAAPSTTNTASSPVDTPNVNVGKVTKALETEEGIRQINESTKGAVDQVDDNQSGVGGESAEKKADEAEQSRTQDPRESGPVAQLNKQREALQKLENQVSELPRRFQSEDFLERKAALLEIRKSINDLENTTQLAASESGQLSLDLKIMGGRDANSQAGGAPADGSDKAFDATFLDVLKGSSVGSGNHGLERAGWIRTELNGLLDQGMVKNGGRVSGRTVSSFAAMLQNPESDERKFLMNLLQTNEVHGGRNLGSLSISRMAAMNLVAAGYNAKTMERDSPSLTYKAEEVGFSTLTKVMYAGTRAGKTTREPTEHIAPRLKALAGMQGVLQAKLFPEGQRVVVNHLLKTNSCLTEFGALMLASVPQDFLILNPELVHKTKELTEKCQAEETESDHFQQNKSDFEKLYEDVRVALDAHEKIPKSDRDELVAMSDQMVIEVHRRGFIKKAVASIGRSFMQNVGAPLGGMKRAVGEFWETASAGVRFKTLMASSRDKAPIPGLLLALEKTNKLSEDEKAAFKNFLSGKAETLNLSEVNKDCLTLEQWNAFKSHVDKTWESAARGAPKPTDLVRYPNGLPAGFYLPPGVVVGSIETKDGSGLSTPVAASAKTVSVMASADAKKRAKAEVSGNQNRCWMRAANAAALEYAGVEAVSEKVFQLLKSLERERNNSPGRGKLDNVVPSNYKPYKPTDQKEVRTLYQNLEQARDKDFELDKDKEEKLQKITLQLALSGLVSNTPLHTGAGLEDSVCDNMKSLFEFKTVQGDATIVVGFLVNSLNMPLVLRTDRDPEGTLYIPETSSIDLSPRNLDEPGKKADTPLIYHTGSIDAGHFQFAKNTTKPKAAQ